MRKIYLIALIIVLIFSSFLYFEFPFNMLKPVFHKDIIDLYAKENNVDPLLITSLIKVESNFSKRARSYRGAIGLMQLLPSTAEELSIELGEENFQENDLENPNVNIKLGTYYFAKLLQEFNGNKVLSLAAYNAGKNKVQNWYRQNPLVEIEISDIPYKETRDYVREVIKTYKWLKFVQELKDLARPKKA